VYLVNVLEYGVISCTDNFINNPLVGVEVEGEARITRGNVLNSPDIRTDMVQSSLFLNENTGSPLCGLGANAALKKTVGSMLQRK